MANEEYKTTVISYDERTQEVMKGVRPEDKPNIQNVLFNVTTAVPHVTETLPTMKVETQSTLKRKVDLGSIRKLNKNSTSLPRFYVREYKRSFRLVMMWVILTALCAALETWALIAILKNDNVNNWVSLLLIPAITICIAFLVVYLNNWRNFRNEAISVDFTQGKIPTINVMKLYKRLKTAHINVNWICGLTYVAGGECLLATFIWAWSDCGKWGVLTPSAFASGPSFLIAVIVISAAMITAFFMHVILLVTNYTRASKIDNYYAVQIVSDDELRALKKNKNKRDLYIFLAVVMILALVGVLIYKLVKTKKVNNTVTINS